MWSWGSIRPSDGVVFLRVWQDHTRNIDGKYWVQISHCAKYRDKPDDLGHQERLKHIEKIRERAKSFLIMCSAVDVKVLPRKIKKFNEKEVFPCGELIELDGEVWIEQLPRVPAETIFVKT
jgi:hypothetical protein